MFEPRRRLGVEWGRIPCVLVCWTGLLEALGEEALEAGGAESAEAAEDVHCQLTMAIASATPSSIANFTMGSVVPGLEDIEKDCLKCIHLLQAAATNVQTCVQMMVAKRGDDAFDSMVQDIPSARDAMSDLSDNWIIFVRLMVYMKEFDPVRDVLKDKDADKLFDDIVADKEAQTSVIAFCHSHHRLEDEIGTMQLKCDCAAYDQEVIDSIWQTVVKFKSVHADGVYKQVTDAFLKASIIHEIAFADLLIGAVQHNLMEEIPHVDLLRRLIREPDINLSPTEALKVIIGVKSPISAQALDVLPHNKSLGALIQFSSATDLGHIDTQGTFTMDSDGTQNSIAPMKFATPMFAVMCCVKDIVLVSTYLHHELLLPPSTADNDISTDILTGGWVNAIAILSESLLRLSELVQDADLLQAERDGWVLRIPLASVITWSAQAASFARVARHSFMQKWMEFLSEVTVGVQKAVPQWEAAFNGQEFDVSMALHVFDKKLHTVVENYNVLFGVLQDLAEVAKRIDLTPGLQLNDATKSGVAIASACLLRCQQVSIVIQGANLLKSCGNGPTGPMKAEDFISQNKSKGGPIPQSFWDELQHVADGAGAPTAILDAPSTKGGIQRTASAASFGTPSAKKQRGAHSDTSSTAPPASTATPTAAAAASTPEPATPQPAVAGSPSAATDQVAAQPKKRKATALRSFSK